MSWKTKVAIVVSVLAVIACLGFIIKYQRDIIEKQKIIETSIAEQKVLADSVVRSQSSYLSKKDLEEYAKSKDISLEPILEDLEKLRADIKSVNTINVITNGVSGKGLPTTAVKPNPEPEKVDPKNPDPFNYSLNEQIFNVNEFAGDVTVPFGTVGFSSWKKDPWSFNYTKRQYFSSTVVGVDEDGRNYYYNKFYIEVDGKRYDLKISEAKSVEVFPEAKFRFYPRLYAGIDGGAYLNFVGGEVTPNLQLFLFSHGKTKPDPNWIFLGLGGGYGVVQNNFNFTISPLAYNVAHHLPFVDNIFIGPSLSLDVKANYAIMLGLRFGL